MALGMDPEQKIISSIIEKHLAEKKNESNPVGSLKEALGLAERELISLVGGGGKTTLMFRLAGELSHSGKKVITTTTTRILEPSSEETPLLIVESDEKKAAELVHQGLVRHRHISLARERVGSDKLKGVAAGVVDTLWKSSVAEYVIVEADGAAGRPIKAPREWEPVIPGQTTLVIAVVGMDGVGAVLNDENVFQAERVSALTGLRVGQHVTAEGLAVLITHPEGIFRGAPASSRVVAFLNKADLPGRIPMAKQVADRILDKGHVQIDRVVLGKVKEDPPVAEVIFAPRG
jgi:probable selenium-dependent hydroxylase accessory protein YqeC